MVNCSVFSFRFFPIKAFSFSFSCDENDENNIIIEPTEKDGSQGSASKSIDNSWIDLKNEMKIQDRIRPLVPPKPDSHHFYEFLTRAGQSIRHCSVRLERLPVLELPKDKPEAGQQLVEAFDKSDVCSDPSPIYGSPLQIPAKYVLNKISN